MFQMIDTRHLKLLKFINLPKLDVTEWVKINERIMVKSYPYLFFHFSDTDTSPNQIGYLLK